MYKTMFILHLFLEILQKYYKIVILGTLGMSGHIHQKRWRQLVGNSDAYLQINNQIDLSIFSRENTL